MRGECIKFISLSFSLVSFQKLYFELFIARISQNCRLYDFYDLLLVGKSCFCSHFFVSGFGLITGSKFEELFSFISKNNPSLYKYLLYIKKYISEGFHAIGFLMIVI